MLRPCRLALVLTAGLLLTSLPAVSAAPEAVLYAGAGATIDGVAAFNGSRVFVRSVLHTPKGQVSDLIVPGSSIRFLASTGSRFLGDSADLLEGGVTLKTSTKFSIHSGCMTASPLSAGARYTVQLLEKTVYVSVHEGEVQVHSLRGVRVSGGKTVAVFCGSPKQELSLIHI